MWKTPEIENIERDQAKQETYSRRRMTTTATIAPQRGRHQGPPRRLPHDQRLQRGLQATAPSFSLLVLLALGAATTSFSAPAAGLRPPRRHFYIEDPTGWWCRKAAVCKCGRKKMDVL